jgi:hypothetical protein
MSARTPRPQRVDTHLRLPSPLYAALRLAAESQGRSANAMLVRLLEAALSVQGSGPVRIQIRAEGARVADVARMLEALRAWMPVSVIVEVIPLAEHDAGYSHEYCAAMRKETEGP